MRRAALFSVYGVALLFWAHELVPLVGLGLAVALALPRGRLIVSRRGLASLGFVVAYVSMIGLPSAYFDPASIWGRLVASPLLAFVALTLIRPTEEEGRRIIACLALSCSLASVLMYVQTGPYQFNLDLASLLTRYRGDGYWLLGRFYQGAPTIGGPAGVALLCSIISGRRFLPLAGLAVAVLVLSVSRGATVAACCGAMFLLLSRRRLLVVVAAATCAYMILPVAVDLVPTAATRYATMFSMQDASLAGRIDRMDEFLHAAWSSPVGNGFSFRISTFTTHNEILGHWVGAGILGVLAYLSFLAHWIWRARGDSEGLAFLTFFGAIGLVEFYSVSSATLLYPLFWLVAATVLIRK